MRWLRALSASLPIVALACAQVIDIPDRHTSPHLACADGACQCDAGFGDCDGQAKNGCETSLASDQSNCGVCGLACDSGMCIDGKCLCAAGFGDCDGDPTNACETNIVTSPDHCGKCGHGCMGGTCTNGACGEVLFAADPAIEAGPVVVGSVVYWGDVNPTGNQLMSAPITGGAPSVAYDFGSRELTTLDVDETGVALMNYTEVVTVDFATKTEHVITTADFIHVDDQVVLVGPDVYFTQKSNNQILRAPRDGSALPVVVAQDLSGSLTRPGMVEFGGALYWIVETGGVATLDGTGAETMVANVPSDDYYGLALDSGHAFVDDIIAVRQYDLATGTESEVQTDDPDTSVNSMSALDGAAAWRENNDILLWDASGAHKVATGLTSQIFPTFVALTNDFVFFPEDDGLHRVAR